MAKRTKSFDFSKYESRYIALRFAYLGHNYRGLAIQKSTSETVEAHLVKALLKTRLIESLESCSYSRCGRTDKGVSALSQVSSLKVRSSFNKDKLEKETQNPASIDVGSELPYVRMLNRHLPPDIRVFAWASLSQMPDFSARFSCKSRTYKYYFVHDNLNIEQMREAASSFIGEHDFRNFCKADVAGGITNYKRTIIDLRIEPCVSNPHDLPERLKMYEFVITGSAFLWHQVRCMVAVLFMVGRQQEQSDIVQHLLDIEKTPRKPNYDMASEHPLVLHSVEYDHLKWIHDAAEMVRLENQFLSTWQELSIKRSIVNSFQQAITQQYQPMPQDHPEIQEPCSWDSISQSIRIKTQKKHKPLLNRGTTGHRQHLLEQSSSFLL